ncbi:cell division protein [Paenibacillus thailandensis]|uniref:Cell division protein n=1 Tax=Paenibacillus thailandensis TaxID=393250 RepID=A0ABW5R1M6_9BACL
MIRIETETRIRAPIELCFDMARDIGLHTRTVWPFTREKAAAGVTEGKIGAGELVTFEATHFGIRQKLTSRITGYDRPFIFVDEMVTGAFKSMRHEHRFEEITACETVMRDTLLFEAPLGVAGLLAERLVLKAYMSKFLHYRNRELKKNRRVRGKIIDITDSDRELLRKGNGPA